MKYSINDLLALRLHKGAIKNRLKTRDVIYTDNQHFKQIEAMLVDEGVIFVCSNANSLGIITIYIISGIESFIKKDDETRKKEIDTNLTGIESKVKDYNSGKSNFKNKESLIRDIESLDGSSYRYSIKTYMGIHAPLLLQYYEERIGDIISEIK